MGARQRFAGVPGNKANLKGWLCIQSGSSYDRPPRPVYPTGLNRVLPAQGFSLSELDDAGVDLDLAERLGLPVDAGRIGAYGPNVTVLRDFVRSSRQPL